ncbi:tail fiber domain-containing protein [Dokdonia sp.]|uniref:tail fiber domain-containing protein n=1 Tax=Dokdonia sp. TaxID=2024995 RepID=UPI00326401F3
MKAFQKPLLICCCILSFYIGIAQSQSINYKAIIRDNAGTILANDLVIIQFTILEGTTNVYSENHTPTTDANGLIVLNIGEGTVLSGDYTTIDWATTDHFLNVQINTGGGLVDMGTTQFLSVPYAMHAQTAENTIGLEDIDEGNGIGWRLKDRDPDNYGPIGENAIDLSSTTSPNTNRGATGTRAFAVGVSTIASGDTSFAIGSANEASGSFSFAGGGANTASGTATFVFGSTSQAIGNVSFASGIGLHTDGYLSAAFGRGNIGGGDPLVWVPTDPLFEIGNGSPVGSNDSNALTVFKNGNIAMADSMISADGVTGELAIALGHNTISNGEYTLTAGEQTEASGESAVAFGTQTRASGNASFVTGIASIATGPTAVAMGFSVEASGTTSFAIGSNTEATTFNTVAMGNATVASGFSAISTGTQTSASGTNAFVLGNRSNASGNQSIAGGDQTIVLGDNAVGLGFGSQAFGDNAFAMGTSAIASSDSEFVIGRYNTLYTPSANGLAGTDRIFVIGNGSSISNQSNAITVLKNGNTGIGTSIPQERLHIADGRLRIGTETVEDTGSNRLEWNCGLFPDTDDSFQLGGSALRWEAVWATDGTINTSDRREKRDIQDLNYGLREILNLNPVRFRWKAKPEQGEKLGLIAQDLLEIIPEVVKTHEYVHTEDTENATPQKKELDRLGVYYTDLIPVLIKAIQEQQEIIQSYKNEQQESKTAIADLQTQLHLITKQLQNIHYEN